jgi:ABC-type Fe3+/spermidine/putrescine transport system ATPase subunit
LEAVNFSIAGRAPIEDLDLRIDEGEFICGVGASGCGKTTRLRLLADLASPDAVMSKIYRERHSVRSRNTFCAMREVRLEHESFTGKIAHRHEFWAAAS